MPGDEDGLDPVALEAAVIEHRPKAIYTIPTFQNPGGSTLSAERREALARIGTLAKPVAPGLRVGWVLAPAEVVDVCRPVKQSLDMNTSSIDQAAAAIYLENVDWQRRTAELRAVYGRAMVAMLDGLGGALPAAGAQR